MHLKPLMTYLRYFAYLIIFVLVTFGPHMYARAQALIFSNSFRFTSLLEILDPVAIATILLAAATFALAKDSGKNIKISKDNILGEHLEREMEELVKPIYMKRNRLEYLEHVHIPYYDETDSFEDWTEEATEFWDLLEADRYLAPKNLRDIIADYSRANREWNKRCSELAEQIREALTREDKRDLCMEAPRDRYLRISPGYFDYRFINLPPSDEKSERIEQIRELADNLESDSNSRHLIEKFITLIEQDTELKDIRELFVERVTARYEELENMIDIIRASLERSS